MTTEQRQTAYITFSVLIMPLLAAVFAYRRAIALNPELVDAHYNLGAAYQLIERYDEAEQAYLSALNIDGTYALAHIGLGELYLDSGLGDCLAQSQSQLC